MVRIGLSDSDDVDDDLSDSEGAQARLVAAGERPAVVAPIAKRAATGIAGYDSASSSELSAQEEDEFGDSVEGDSVDERVETGLAWPPMHRDASVLRADDGYDAMDDNNRGDDGYNDDDYDDDAATALDRSAAGLSLPSQLGLSASRVQLLNSVLFQDEYRDEDGIRRVAALDRHTAAPPNYWGRVPASPMHVTMSQEARPRADEDVMAFLSTSASASSMVPRFIAASQPAPRMFAGRVAEQNYHFRAGWAVGERLATRTTRAAVAHEPLRQCGSASAVASLLAAHRRHGWAVAAPQLTAAANAFVRDASASATDTATRQTWELVGALWGTLAAEERDPNAQREHRRRHAALARWLRAAVAPIVDAELARGGSPLWQCAVLLAAGRAAEAIALCAGAGNSPRLAAVLAACVGSRGAKQSAERQLKQWAADNATGFVDVDAVRCLQIVMGGTEEVFASLDWRRRLGVLLWYRFPDRPVGAAVRALQNMFGSADASPDASRERCAEGTDIQYQLLRLYAQPGLDAGAVLRPEAWGGAQLDWSSCWLLRWALSHMPLRPERGEARVVPSLASDATVGAGLTRRLAGQLEALDLWEWAIYAVLSCRDTTPDVAQRSVVAILNRWAPEALPQPMADDLPALHAWLLPALQSARHLHVTTGAAASASLDWDAVHRAAAMVAHVRTWASVGRAVALAVLRPHPARSAQLLQLAQYSAPGWWGRAALECCAAVADCPRGPPSAALAALAGNVGAWSASLERAARESGSLDERHALSVVASRLRAVAEPSVAPSVQPTDEYRRNELWAMGEAYLQQQRAQ